jgi:hypothetical protein
VNCYTGFINWFIIISSEELCAYYLSLITELHFDVVGRLQLTFNFYGALSVLDQYLTISSESYFLKLVTFGGLLFWLYVSELMVIWRQPQVETSSRT